MTWVIENKNLASKVAFINLKVCIALLNICILLFLLFHDGGAQMKKSSCLVMNFQFTLCNTETPFFFSYVSSLSFLFVVFI